MFVGPHPSNTSRSHWSGVGKTVSSDIVVERIRGRPSSAAGCGGSAFCSAASSSESLHE